ncbi:hypothetical protein B0J13DRAFT_580607 [Dactylonectria estremocensis]|uniref:TPR repeat-containing protein n=1 Tax=Dactylonectria estremocensis TaxID=1079267 RepID=A0A9P9FKR3_9HYPO|nr:hypothetical protein B0J13DRAFT_580607 [Dactylonectria estremocensis]
MAWKPRCGTALRAGHYASVLLSAVPAASTSAGETTDAPAPAPVSAPASAALIQAFATHLAASPAIDDAAVVATAVADVPQSLAVGIAALNAFLQVNVTGPVFADATAVNARLTKAWTDAQTGDASASLGQLHKACLRDLGVDGVSPYAYIPHLELFALARYILNHTLKGVAKDTVEIPSDEGALKHSLAWMRLRVHVWHYKLLTQPSLSSGSNFTRSSQWSDVPTLAAQILDSIDAVRSRVLAEEVWSTDADSWSREDKVQFLVEAANNYILLGRDDKARDTLKEAAQTSGLVYALSGALGKRTKFQEKSISQLVVLAKSGVEAPVDEGDKELEAKPDALQLNNDTLLEEIHFTKEKQENEDPKTALPAALKDLAPDDQPQLSPIDQIILLTEATLKDAFSPADTLTAEEVLPFAVRVIGDKSTNWQIYTQALLVRSRIEVHRSRTIERGVLQMQAVADQVMSDTTAEAQPEPEVEGTGAPVIEISAPGETVSKPTSFLPAPKASESAPAHIRLQYIHALSSPPRWHLESELAYAWAGVGSLTSALEIFKRLRLWAEVALCLASTAATEDEDGRGSGGEAKAKGIVRWRLFQRAADAATDFDDENIGEQVMYLKADDYTGPERDPPPPDAPRLLCILGDLENEPAHYERAWELSKHRFARAQRSLAEHHLQAQDLEKAHDAYTKATAVNRLSPDMWSRLGDIRLRLGRFDDAAAAFNRSISCASDTAGGEDARTWSNLGSALWSLYVEVTSQEKQQQPAKPEPVAVADDEEDDGINGAATAKKDPLRDPATLLAQALAAYKKGASIAHSNWRIWDNVLTLAARMHPPAVAEIVLALRHIITIRQSEDALDIDVLTALLQDVVLSKDKPAGDGIYEPPRGSHERLVARIIEEDVVPLITKRSELWALVSRLRGWRRDRVGAIEAAERAWRAALGSAGGRLLPGAAATAADEARDWTADEGAWAVVVERTDALVSVLENWGPEVDTIGPKWKGKARLAVRSVMNKGRESWEGTDGWTVLEGLMENLKSS